jgi:hypothetical protein
MVMPPCPDAMTALGSSERRLRIELGLQVLDSFIGDLFKTALSTARVLIIWNMHRSDAFGRL